MSTRRSKHKSIIAFFLRKNNESGDNFFLERGGWYRPLALTWTIVGTLTPMTLRIITVPTQYLETIWKIISSNPHTYIRNLFFFSVYKNRGGNFNPPPHQETLDIHLLPHHHLYT